MFFPYLWYRINKNIIIIIIIKINNKSFAYLSISVVIDFAPVGIDQKVYDNISYSNIASSICVSNATNAKCLFKNEF